MSIRLSDRRLTGNAKSVLGRDEAAAPSEGFTGIADRSASAIRCKASQNVAIGSGGVIRLFPTQCRLSLAA